MLNINTVYDGFKLYEIQEVNEINSKANIFVHEKTGARLIFLENDDENKVFSITFKTPPKDSTGVAHILEHSVLCGSEKFPVKEPFVELAKGSLNTFLNAMTFADKTMYPIASTNDKDFVNLMNVYLDAVFKPKIYEDKYIFNQEGWHYELKSEDEAITYKGVVYNEMKGAFSSPESILYRKISETLFKDNTYGEESGGDPDNIPELTYENFLDFHRKYYHPSNSYIFLYGDLNIKEQLKFINENYLKGYDKKEVDSNIKKQEPFKELVEKEAKYSINKDEDAREKTFLSLNYKVADFHEGEKILALEILEDILLEAQGAPLKKALLNAGLGKDVFGIFDNGILQPALSIVVKNTEENKKEEFKNLVKKTLENLVEKGIDKKAIEASINKKEFELRENTYQSYPKGIIFNIKILNSWLYDGNPLQNIEYEEYLKNIKSSLATDYFEKLIKEVFFENNHSSLLVVKPEKGLEEEKNKKVEEKLKKYKESLSKEELQGIINDTENLEKRQTIKDTKEALETIPMIKIEDLDKKAEEIPYKVKEYGDSKVLHTNIFTNKIIYSKFVFNTHHIDEEYIPYLNILSRALGRVDTNKRTFEEYSRDINIYTGGLEFSPSAYFYNDNTKDYFPYFMASGKVVNENVGKLMELLEEGTLRSRFHDKHRLKQVVMELKSRVEMTLMDRGHSVAAGRALAYNADNNKYLEKLSGLYFYKFLSKLEKNFDSEFDNLERILKKLSKDIFNKNNLTISVTCSDEDYKTFEREVSKFYDKLDNKEALKKEYLFKDLDKKKEGYITPGKVQYVAKAASLKNLGYKVDGKSLVLKSILSLDYLWNRVRVMGGAYGGFSGIQRSGNIYFVSYRDPNLTQTIDAYDEAYEYLKNFKADERTMTKYIIGTISDLDSPLTPSQKGSRVLSNYIRGVKQEDIQKEREEVLSTSEDDIKNLAKMIKAAMEDGEVCVIGSEAKINSSKGIFESIENLLD